MATLVQTHLHLLAILLLGASKVSSHSSSGNLSLQIDAFNALIDSVIPALIGQKPSNSKGPVFKHRTRLLEDVSNDELDSRATPQDMILRAGFSYENHYVTSKDGYITQMIRIVNPLADEAKLKQPPVIFIHGGLIDQTSFIWGSNIQHHPEHYPRLPKHGPMTSSNRSLAFTLSNNGYDVWLAGTRGSNRQNQGHVKYKINEGPDIEQLLGLDEDDQKYWRYSMDEIVEYELPRQIDKVMSLTGAKNVSIMALSLGTQTSMSLFISKPEYAKKTHLFINMAPIVNNIGVNRIFVLLHNTICMHLPNSLGISLFTRLLTTQVFRNFLSTIFSSKKLRYTIFWKLLDIIAGASRNYQTFLEPALYSHLFQDLSFVEVKHYCQQVVAHRLQRFDHGIVGNLKRYGSISPPVHDLSKMGVENWVLVTSGGDNLASPASGQQVLEETRPRPKEHLHVKQYSHVDLVAGVENDVLVNLPLLQIFDRFQLPPLKE